MLTKLTKAIVVGATALALSGAEVLPAQNQPDLLPNFGQDVSPPGVRLRFLRLKGDTTTVNDVTQLQAGKTYEVQAQIKNEGNASTVGGEKCIWRFFDASNNEILPPVTNPPTAFFNPPFFGVNKLLSTFQTTETGITEITIPANFPTYLNAKIELFVDSDNVLVESNENNNKASRTIDIIGLGVDLAVFDFKVVTPTTLIENENLTFSFKVKNNDPNFDSLGDRTWTLCIAKNASLTTSPQAVIGQIAVALAPIAKSTTWSSGNITVPLDLVGAYDGSATHIGVKLNGGDGVPANDVHAIAKTIKADIPDYEAGTPSLGTKTVDDLGRNRYSPTVLVKNLNSRTTVGEIVTVDLYVSPSNSITDPAAVMAGTNTTGTEVLGGGSKSVTIPQFTVPACLSQGAEIYFIAVVNADNAATESMTLRANNTKELKQLPPAALVLPSGVEAILEYVGNASGTQALGYDKSPPVTTPPTPTHSPNKPVEMCLTTTRSTAGFYFAVWSGTKAPFTYDAFSSFTTGLLGLPFFVDWFGPIAAGTPVKLAFDFPKVTFLPAGTFTVYTHAVVFKNDLSLLGFANNKTTATNSPSECGLQMVFTTVN